MARFIVKLTEGDESWYLMWSSVVDAPVTYGMSREQFRQWYLDGGEPDLRNGDHIDERIARTDRWGTSLLGDGAEGVISFNRAGPNESCLTKQEIIEQYCRNPRKGTRSWRERSRD